MITHLVYASSAPRLLSAEDVLAILRTSRRNNARDGVTGMLLYHAGTFLQVLEGEAEAVDGVFERVRGDARHRNVQVLLREAKPRRFFGEWAMGFRDVTGLDPAALGEAEGVSPLLQRGFSAEAFGAEPQRAHRLLLSFRSVAERTAGSLG